MSFTSQNGPVLKQLLPPGPAFDAQPGSNMEQLLDGLGTFFDRWNVIADELLTEFDPRTTTNFLSNWETIYGLPGTNPTPPATVPARQAALWAKEQGYATVTPAYVIGLAAALGYTITISARCFPVAYATAPCFPTVLNNDPWAYVWIVNYVPGAQDATLKWTINNVCPSNTLVVYNPMMKPMLIQRVDYSKAISASIISSWMLQENTGVTCNDSSGQLHPLTLSGTPAPTWVAGDYGPAVNFVSGSALANSGVITGLQLPLSFMLSFNLPSVTAIQVLTQFNVGGLGLYVQSGNLLLTNQNTPISLSCATGKHVAIFTISGTGAGVLYLDSAANSTAGALGLSVAPTMITLANNTAGGASIAGNINFGTLWNNRVLSASDVTALFANPFITHI